MATKQCGVCMLTLDVGKFNTVRKNSEGNPIYRKQCKLCHAKMVQSPKQALIDKAIEEQYRETMKYKSLWKSTVEELDTLRNVVANLESSSKDTIQRLNEKLELSRRTVSQLEESLETQSDTSSESSEESNEDTGRCKTPNCRNVNLPRRRVCKHCYNASRKKK